MSTADPPIPSKSGLCSAPPRWPHTFSPRLLPLPTFTELPVPRDSTASSCEWGQGTGPLAHRSTDGPTRTQAHARAHRGRPWAGAPAGSQTDGQTAKPGVSWIQCRARLVRIGLYYAMLFQLIIRGTLPQARSGVSYYFPWPAFHVHSRCSLASWRSTGWHLRRGGGERQGRAVAVSTGTAFVSGPAPELIALKFPFLKNAAQHHSDAGRRGSDIKYTLPITCFINMPGLWGSKIVSYKHRGWQTHFSGHNLQKNTSEFLTHSHHGGS